MSADEKQESDDILVEEGEVAGDYLEGLLDILDYDGDIDLDVEGDRATVTVDGSEDLKNLVGGDGKVLEALQELTRLTVQQDPLTVWSGRINQTASRSTPSITPRSSPSSPPRVSVRSVLSPHPISSKSYFSWLLDND